MSSIHHFQRYSSKENVATNNTLQLFSRLYHYSPAKFETFINGLSEKIELNVGLNFTQQQKVKGKSKKGSVPDGSIHQDSFKIVIETKLHENFPEEQLIDHLEAFSDEESKILLGLSPVRIKHEIEQALRNHILNNTNLKNVEFCALTFSQLVEGAKSVLEPYEFEIHELVDDYERYCIESELIKNVENRMMAFVCGTSFNENLKYDIYYCPDDRNFSEFGVLGLYKEQSVKAFGKLKNHVKASLKSDGGLYIDYQRKELSKGEIERIIGIIHEPKENPTWDISKGHQFFLVEKFYEIDYKKKTPRGIQKMKSFNLKELGIDFENHTSMEEASEILNKNTWE